MARTFIQLLPTNFIAMNNLTYYSIRIGLLCVIVLLGLVVYAPQTLDLAGAWSGAHQKSDYIDNTEVTTQSSRDQKQEADSRMMLDAINQDLKSVEYVFSKNRFRPYNQRDWWPSIHAAAIEADNAEVLKYFLNQGYLCDYSNIYQGVPAFRAAAASSDFTYLDMLTANCDTTPAQFRPSLKELITNSLYPERLKLLD